MDLALRRRLDGVEDVRISQEHQTADVVFAPGARPFSPGEFRAAVKEADVEVVTFEMDACGRFESGDGSDWFVAGPNRFLVAPEGEPQPTGRCISAILRDQVAPGRLERLRALPERVP
jgi:hypothetical protein